MTEMNFLHLKYPKEAKFINSPHSTSNPLKKLNSQKSFPTANSVLFSFFNFHPTHAILAPIEQANKLAENADNI